MASVWQVQCCEHAGLASACTGTDVAASAVIQYSQPTAKEQVQEFDLDVHLPVVNQKHTIGKCTPASLRLACWLSFREALSIWSRRARTRLRALLGFDLPCSDNPRWWVHPTSHDLHTKCRM